MITKTLRMRFVDTEGHLITISIPHPKENLSKANVEEVGSLIASKGVLKGNQTNITAYKDAAILTTEKQALS